jgi:hypothetical protein
VQGEGVAWAAVNLIKGLEAMGPRINLRYLGSPSICGFRRETFCPQSRCRVLTR